MLKRDRPEIEKNTEKEIISSIESQKSYDITKTNIVFPLIFLNYKGKKYKLVDVNIRWDNTINSLRYIVREPNLTVEEYAILEKIKNLLRQRIDIDISKIRNKKVFYYLIKDFEKIKKEEKLQLTDIQNMKFLYYIYRDFIGLGKIEPLMHDPNIEDISCDGVNLPVFVYHRDPHFGEMATNIYFFTKEELDDFVMLLAQRCNRSVSVANPILDGALPDGSRVHATYGVDIAMKGSNFTIRKFTARPLTPTDLIRYGSATPEVFAYLWLAIENGMSIIIAGPAASGKTTFLNAISLFIKSDKKVISIEDTPELRLPLPNWVPEVSRVGAHGYGEVTMFDLLKAALRQRPDYIIVGEVRGREAYVLFQGMATGHPALGTLHADSIQAAIDRLTTKPINLPLPILSNLDLIVFLTLQKRGHIYVRRVKEINEIIGYNHEKKDLDTKTSFKWDAYKDEIHFTGSYLLGKIAERMGYTMDQLKEDLANRTKVIWWMYKKNIIDPAEISRIVNLYYVDPNKVLEMIQ